MRQERQDKYYSCLWLSSWRVWFNLERNIENNIFFQLPSELEETIACMCFSP